ncbi:MAG: trigger factor [Alphaproteobacteria bacterium]
MQVEETKSDGLALELKVTVPAEDIQAKIDDRLARLGRNARVPGFRPGKIPLKVLRGRYAKQVLGEVLEELVSNSSQEVLREREIKPALQPQISIDSYDEGQALEYSMAIDLMPETGDVDLKGISVTRPVAEVSDSDIDKVLENIAARNKQFKPVEKPRAAKEGDQAVIDFVGRVDGEEFEGGKAEDAPLELGSGMFIPGFEEQLLGAKPGDRVEV